MYYFNIARQLRVIHHIYLKVVVWIIWVSAYVQAAPFGRHAAHQLIEETLRYKHAFFYNGYADCLAAQVLLTAFVLGTDYNPRNTFKQRKLTRGSVVLIILFSYYLLKVTQ